MRKIKTLAEKYGKNGEKGRRAEEFVSNTLTSWGWSVIDYDNNMNMQRKGCDLSVHNPTWQTPCTVDVKGNMRADGSFYVENDEKGWLRNPTKISDLIWHCNVDTGWMAWYNRKDMLLHLENNPSSNNLVLVKTHEGDAFITRMSVSFKV